MTKPLVPYSDSSHKHILTRHTENKDFQGKRVIWTSFSKGVTFKNRKKKSQRIMNFSLHLQTIFTFIRQNAANSQERNNPYTYTRTVLDICLLCTWTRRPWIYFGWKVYWKHSPCTYTYIHISRAAKLSDVANPCFLPFPVVMVFPPCNIGS